MAAPSSLHHSHQAAASLGSCFCPPAPPPAITTRTSRELCRRTSRSHAFLPRTSEEDQFPLTTVPSALPTDPTAKGFAPGTHGAHSDLRAFALAAHPAQTSALIFARTTFPVACVLTRAWPLERLFRTALTAPELTSSFTALIAPDSLPVPSDRLAHRKGRLGRRGASSGSPAAAQGTELAISLTRTGGGDPRLHVRQGVQEKAPELRQGEG